MSEKGLEDRRLDVEDESEKQPLSEAIMDTIQGKDEPIEVSHPEVPPLLVFGSYFIGLMIAIVVIIISIWVYRG